MNLPKHMTPEYLTRCAMNELCAEDLSVDEVQALCQAVLEKITAQSAVREAVGANGQRVVLMETETGLKEVDFEVWPLVKALNDGGLATTASCSGHGHLPPTVILKDGRWIIVVKDFDEAHGVLKRCRDIWPRDINGDLIAVDLGAEVTLPAAQDGELREAAQNLVNCANNVNSYALQDYQVPNQAALLMAKAELRVRAALTRPVPTKEKL
jgi:hypothetical protein